MKTLNAKYNIIIVFIILVMLGLATFTYIVPAQNTIAEETIDSINNANNSIEVNNDELSEIEIKEIAKRNREYYNYSAVRDYVLRSMQECRGYTSTIEGSLPMGKIMGIQYLSAKKSVNNLTKQSLVTCSAVIVGNIGFNISKQYYSTPEKICVKEAEYVDKKFSYKDEYATWTPGDFVEQWGLHPSEMYLQLKPEYIKSGSFLPTPDGYTLYLTTDAMAMTAKMFQFCFTLFGTPENGKPQPKADDLYFTVKIDYYGNLKSIKFKCDFSCSLDCINIPVTIHKTVSGVEVFLNYNKDISITPLQ